MEGPIYNATMLQGELNSFLREREVYIDPDLVVEVTNVTVNALEGELGVGGSEITSSTALIGDLGIDSFSNVRIRIELEGRLGIDIPREGLVAYDIFSVLEFPRDYERVDGRAMCTSEGIETIRERYAHLFATMDQQFIERFEQKPLQDHLQNGQNVLGLLFGAYKLALEQESERHRRKESLGKALS